MSDYERCRTSKNVLVVTATTSPVEVLGPNPRRKAIIMTPVAIGSGGIVTRQSFAAGLGQTWQVPVGVTQVADIYCWGCGGNSGAAGAVLGGGGGGGGGFCTSGALTVIPGSIYQVQVGAGGSANNTTLIAPTGSTIVNAGRGTTAVADAAGGAGAAATGANKFVGGAGFAATGLAGAGGGGGGSGGSFSAGQAGVNSVGGAAGGAATIGAFGAGAVGGAGGASGVVGVAGVIPGSGGGGSGNNAGAGLAGGDGRMDVFYTNVAAVGYVGMDFRQDATPASSTLRWGSGQAWQTVLSDRDIGEVITLPWWLSSTSGGEVFSITEVMYDDD